jgi:hypothetical protein
MLKVCCQFLEAEDVERVVKCLSKLCRTTCIPVMVPRFRFRGEMLVSVKEDVLPHIKTLSCYDFLWMDEYMALLIGLRHLKIRDNNISTPDFKDWKIPDQITHLTLEGKFDQPIVANVLPPSLHTLVFGPYFNQPIVPGVLPAGLHTLEFGIYFRQKFAPGSLPSNLHTLTLGDLYNQELSLGDNVLPPSLTRLDRPYSYDDLLRIYYSGGVHHMSTYKKRKHP